jgi:hypothetical protein
MGTDGSDGRLAIVLGAVVGREEEEDGVSNGRVEDFCNAVECG